MGNPIPDFDHNLVLPPHLGDPVNRDQLSPYPCTTVDLCQRFGTTTERRAILGKFLDFRDRVRGEGLTNGFQWLDGSFLEDVETRENRPPKDLDVVTVYWGYDRIFQAGLAARFREFASPRLAKSAYGLDHYNFDASHDPTVTMEQTRYWILLFSHNRQGVWKGMLRIELNTPAEDALARQQLGGNPP
jgi:hypothetical protein